jgi:hypothetical protein
MIIKDIGVLSELPHIDQIPLFDRDHTSVKAIDFMVAHQTLKLETDRATADSVMGVMIDEVRMSTMLGEIEESALANLKLPKKPLLMSKLLQMLKGFSMSERQAIVFSLLTGQHIRESIMLSRREVNGDKWPAYTANLLRSVTPNIRSPYLFWKTADNGEAVPLLDIEFNWKEISGESWCSFQRSFGDIIINMPPNDEELRAIACVWST